MFIDIIVLKSFMKFLYLFFMNCTWGISLPDGLLSEVTLEDYDRLLCARR